MLIRGQNTEKFNHALAVLNQELKELGKLNLQSQPVHAEDFYLRLLNKLYGWHLVNKNEHDPNAKAVDLIDEDAKLFVQVTVTCDSARVNRTLGEQVMQEYANRGYHAMFLFVGEQKDSIKTSKAIRNPYRVTFNQKKDLVLTKDLANKFTHSDVELQQEVLQLIAVETGDSSCDPDVVDATVIQSINAHLERRKAGHPSFRLMGEIDRGLLPKGVIPNSARTVVPVGGEPVPFGGFIRDSWESGDQCHLLITGEGGVGKTVALLTLATEEGFLPHGVAAVYVPLHELAQHCGEGPDKNCVDRFLAADFPGKGGALDDARRLACRGWDGGPSLILLMDGYNEIPNDRRNAVDKGIAKWAAWPGVQVITTSRELATFGVRHMRRLRLEPLSQESARAYLEGCGIKRVPDPDDKIWQVIQTPLMLRLFVDSESFDGADEGYVTLEEPDCAGHLVWNYLQRELVRCVRNQGKYKPIEYVAAILLTLPHVCWGMESDFEFSVGHKELRERVRLACSRWEDRELPEAFMSVEGDRLGYLDELGSLTSRRNLDKQLAILAEETALLTARRGKDKKAIYSLMHQNFRDCLAALHVRNAIESDSDTVPEELYNPLSPFVKGYLAELASDDLLRDTWEANREALPTNATVTHNLLGTIDRKRDGCLTALDWSGMDLTRMSLVGYRRDSRLHISQESLHFERTKLEINCFLPQGHTGAVSSVCFSPDGRLLASGSDDGSVRLWDAATGSPAMAPLEGHRDWVSSVCFSPDGRLLASGSYDGTVRLWDAATGSPALAPLEGHGDWVSSVCFSPDGRLLASGSDDGSVRLWDAATGSPAMAPLEGHGGWVRSVCFSPDGRLLASGSADGSVRLWDATTGQLADSIVLLYGIDLMGLDFSLADVSEEDKRTLRWNGVKFDHRT